MLDIVTVQKTKNWSKLHTFKKSRSLRVEASDDDACSIRGRSTIFDESVRFCVTQKVFFFDQ